MEKFFKNLKETDKLRLYLGLGLLTFIIHNNLPYIKLKLSELDKSISENMHPVYAPLIFWMVLFIGVAIYVINDLKRNK